MSLSSDNRNKVLGVAVAAIILLLGVNAYLLYNKSKLSSQNNQLTSQLTETERLKAELEGQYDMAIKDLETQKSDNVEMNTLIETQKTELQTQKSRIAGLVKSKTDISAAKAKLDNLLGEYRSQIDQLKAANEKLSADNTNLNTQNNQLTTDLQTEKSTTADLSTAKAALVSDKQNLTSQNENLNRKVTRASVIGVSEVKITGFKVDEKDREKKKKYAKNINRLRVTFNAAANQITDGGTEAFYIRLISPLGESLAREDMGSGTLTTTDTKEKVRYTTMKEINYANSKTEVSLNWDQTEELAKGLYKVEIFNKGYKCGEGNFKLK